MAVYGLPGNWEYWARKDMVFLALSKKMVVLMLWGWRESNGIRHETDFARKLNIPIEYAEWRPWLLDGGVVT